MKGVMIRGNVIEGGLEGNMNDDEDGVTMVDPRVVRTNRIEIALG
jgi:hypothetical protein